jgi:hypothetical protein
LNIALKEWASVCTALEAGLQICLLRKGGIVEADRGGFELRHRRFLLFPTYAHEHTLLLQEAFKPFVRELEDSSHEISCVCEVTDVVVTPGDASLRAALQHVIWNEAFLEKRLQYKPNLPLYAILLRAYRLPSPIRLPDRPSYAGCKSWVHLTEEINIENAMPVLNENEFCTRRNTLLGVLKTGAQQPNLVLR